MKWRIALLVLALASADVGPLSAQSIVGKWLGLESPQQQVKCWLNNRRQDGTFDVTFLVAAPFGLRQQVEQGTWSFADGLYSTITTQIDGRTVNPADPQFRDTYRVIKLTEDKFVYSHIDGRQFPAYRMPDSFVLGQTCPADL
jgi:hypothetical protein